VERVIKRGAEADILLGSWGGLQAVFKVRIPKPYLHPKLDSYLRSIRTAREASNMGYAKRIGVPTPAIYYVSLKGSTIVMQYVRGRRLKDLIEDEPSLGGILGKYLAILHEAGLAHGDPTTANLILDDETGKFVLIDFGLSLKTKDVEDFAVDVHLVKEMLMSTHQRVFKKAFENFREAYLAVIGEEFFKKVMRRMSDIEKRGRYTRVE
jgi:TP53 regulating kinase-like protein